MSGEPAITSDLIMQPARLSPLQVFRLVEIAHESRDSRVKEAALLLLEDWFHPPHVYGPGDVVRK